jgi:hypothetical protein
MVYGAVAVFSVLVGLATGYFGRGWTWRYCIVCGLAIGRTCTECMNRRQASVAGGRR